MISKSELVKKLAENTGETQKLCDYLLSSLGDTITELIQDGGKVAIPGFVTFEVIDVPEKVGKMNVGIHKGKTFVKPACKKMKATISPVTQKKINNEGN